MKRSIELLAAFFLFIPLTFAEDAVPEKEPIEIIVRGSTLPDLLKDSPTSLSVLTPSETEARGADQFVDVMDSVPSLTWAGGTSRPRFFQIRGIGEVEQYEGAPNPSVGLIVDGIDFSGLGIGTSLFDLSQVEVLRGPQETRYGSSALAGAVVITSQEPTAYQSGQAEFSGGSDGLIAAGLALGGKVDGTGDRLRVRVSTYNHSSDGFRDDQFLNRDDTNKRDESTSRIKLLWQETSELSLGLTGIYIDNDNGYDAFAIDNSLRTQSDEPGEDSMHAGAGAFRILWQPERSFEIESVTAYLDAQSTYSYDGDWGNEPFWAPNNPYSYFASTDRARRSLQQSIWFRSSAKNYKQGETSRWSAGLFGEQLKEGSLTKNFAGADEYDRLESDYKSNSGALFGEYEVPLGKGLALRIGGREEYRTVDYEDSRSNSGSPNDWMWGGHVTLDKVWSETLRNYLTFSRGFKGGGVNTALNIPDAQRFFDAEYLYNSEVGIITNTPDNSITTRSALFAGLRRDVQTKLSYQSDPSDPLTFAYLTDNAAKGINYGLETEVNYEPSDNWQFTLSGTLLDTKYTDAGGDEILEDREQSTSPNWQYYFATTYKPVDHWFVRAELTGKDSYYYQDSHNETSSAYYLLNVSAGYRDPTWSWTVWTRNVTDERYAVRGFFFGNEPPYFESKEYIQRGDPISFGTTVKFYF